MREDRKTQSERKEQLEDDGGMWQGAKFRASDVISRE